MLQLLSQELKWNKAYHTSGIKARKGLSISEEVDGKVAGWRNSSCKHSFHIQELVQWQRRGQPWRTTSTILGEDWGVKGRRKKDRLRCAWTEIEITLWQWKKKNKTCGFPSWCWKWEGTWNWCELNWKLNMFSCRDTAPIHGFSST